MLAFGRMDGCKRQRPDHIWGLNAMWQVDKLVGGGEFSRVMMAIQAFLLIAECLRLVR